MPSPDADTMRSSILELLGARAPASSICPSDAARSVGGDRWREWMDTVRDVAGELADRGVLRVTQGADEVDARSARGPIRLRRGPSFDDPPHGE